MSKLGRILVAVGAAVAVAAAALSVAPSASATPYTNRPTLKLSSGIVIVFHYMAVTGNGYVPFEIVTISLDQPTHVLSTIKADSAGHFVTNVLVPGGTPIGSHTVIGTGQFAQNGFDVAKASVIVVLNAVGLPIAYERPLPAPPAGPFGVTTSPGEGLAVTLGIAGAVLIMLASGAYILIAARRRTSRS